MAAELVERNKVKFTVDKSKADIFSLGAILYELMTGIN